MDSEVVEDLKQFGCDFTSNVMDRGVSHQLQLVESDLFHNAHQITAISIADAI